MKKLIFIIIVTFITLLASFPLVSCQGSAAPSQTVSPSTTPAVTTTEPPAATTTTPIQPTPTPTPTPSAITPIVTPDSPYVKPYLIDGKSALTVDNSSQDYKKILIKAGVTNTGKTTANNVTVDLYNSSTKIYTWNTGPIAPGENKVLEATVENILKQSNISAGQYSLNINCYLSGQGTTGSKSDTYKAMVAPAPVERRPSQSNVEKMIQDAIDKSTWYTSANKAELMTILKEVLKDAGFSWSAITIDLLPFDKFNDAYSDYYGKTDAEKQQIKTSIAGMKLRSFCLNYGTNVSVQITLREGTFIQVFPLLVSSLGSYEYFMRDIGAYNTAATLYGTSLASYLLEDYACGVMRERYGLSGLINMSAKLNTVSHPSLTGTISTSVNLRRMWAIAADEGYPNGDLPADKLLKAYLNLTGKGNPTSYLGDLDKKGDLIDKTAVDNIIRWRLANKDLTMLPADIATKIDPSNSAQSLDNLIANQDIVWFP